MAPDPESVLACYFASAAGAERESEWIDAALVRVEFHIERGQWASARAACASFAVDIEGHFAFEELVIARTGFSHAREHRLNHAAGLAIINDLIRGLHSTGTASIPDRDTTSLLAELTDFRLYAKAHADRHDRALCRHAGHLASMTKSRPGCA